MHAQVQGELEQERAKSKAAVGRVRKDLESERDLVNAALKEVRSDLDKERERGKNLSSTLEAANERSRTISSQLEAANKQVRSALVPLCGTQYPPALESQYSRFECHLFTSPVLLCSCVIGYKP